MSNYQVLEHTADLKIMAWGKNEAELFQNMVLGLQETMLGRPINSIKPIISRKVELEGEKVDWLLIDFLNEVIFLSETYNEVYSNCEVKIKDSKLEAVLRGNKTVFDLEVKAATFHDFEFKRENNMVKAVVVFDI